MERYIVDLISAIRTPKKYTEQLDNWIEYRTSPRATTVINRASRTHA